MLRHKKHASQGQALLEFALIATVLLMILFLIIESARILQAWITLQSATRAGARYAITGQSSFPCAVSGLPKYVALCDDPKNLRVASIIDVTHRGLSGLPLNEASGTFEDDNYYDIQVWGVDETGTIQPYHGGTPNNPVIVRVIYRVPIITPFFQPILPSIPVFGQTTLNNEPFGSLGGTGQGAGVPPPLPPLPTPGVTPSPTPTDTPGPSPSPTATATATSTSTPIPCPVHYIADLVDGQRTAIVSGLWDAGGGNLHTVDFYDLTVDPGETTPLNPIPIRLIESPGHACPGVGEALNVLNPPLVVGHIIRARHSDGSFADRPVLPGTPTPTTTPTETASPTIGPTNTPTATSSPTPMGPFIQMEPPCGFAPSTVQATVFGFNWGNHRNVSLYWNGALQGSVFSDATGFFQLPLVLPLPADGTYTMLAVAGTSSFSLPFLVPCANITPTPGGATATPTPAPADLVIVGQPVLISTPPIVQYQPVAIQVVITNTGGVDVNQQFFVDIFFDPTQVFSTSIPLNQSNGYTAIGGLGGGETRVLTITSELGFTTSGPNVPVFGWVDSLQQVQEVNETNNISSGLPVPVTPGPSPTPSPTPNGSLSVSGFVLSFNNGWAPQPRARVWLLEEGNPTNPLTLYVDADLSGDYIFHGVPGSMSFTAIACLHIDGVDYVYQRPAITAPSTGIGLFMQVDPAGCPVQ